jgi:hypothetical protein
MNGAIRDWCDRAWTETASLPGSVMSELRARWDAHSQRDQVVVTFFGPYDSGKSSLLKRLLVDEGQPIPNWLTVSGRRETFEPREAEVMGVVVLDTPGIAGGNELHEQVAKEALLLSDVVVLVLPPQLVTSDRDAIVSVMSGRRFRCSAEVAFSPRGLVVVLSRMDEAGAMPGDDLAGYRTLVKRKREELGEILRAEGGAENVVVVHAVAADPFGLVGNSIPQARSEYDADRSWDGVAAFGDFLRTLPARRPELRLHSEVRFLGAELGAVAASLAQMDVESRTAAEAASNEASSHALVQERLRALLGAARADLDRRIEEEVSAATRRGAADVKELREAVLGRLEAALERWAKEHDSALEAIVREADAEMKVRRERPAWKKLLEVLNGPSAKPEPATGGKGPRETIDKVQRLTKTLHKGFREAQPAVLGMSLEKARNELQRLQRAASFEEYAKQTSRGATRLRDAAHASQTRRAVLLDVGFEVAVPAILELGGLVAEAWVEHKVAQQRAARREEVRRVIEDSSKKLADRAWSLWRDEGMPSAVEAAVAEARTSAEGAAALLKDETERISQGLASVSKLLRKLSELETP